MIYNTKEKAAPFEAAHANIDNPLEKWDALVGLLAPSKATQKYNLFGFHDDNIIRCAFVRELSFPPLPWTDWSLTG